jgi:hypothetical protein
MKNLILFSAVVIIIFSVSSCSKGTNGARGPAGPAGPDSIIYSSWITLALTLSVDANNDSSYSQTITAAAITSTVLDQGAVVSYVGIPGAGANGDTLVINGADLYTYTGGGYLTQDMLPGTIDLYFNFDITSGGTSDALYRYVIIPGSILGSSVFQQYTQAQLRGMDYATIKKLISAATAQTKVN